MRIHSRRLKSQRSTATVPAGSGSTVLVPFNRRSHRLAKLVSAPFTSEWLSTRAAARPVLAATGEFATDKSTASGVTIDSGQVRKNGSAARIREEASNENNNRLTLTDLAVIVYVTMATVFYPALAWLLFRTRGCQRLDRKPRRARQRHAAVSPLRPFGSQLNDMTTPSQDLECLRAAIF
jgi:hypothetical protein